jgi:hypothetical protein
LTVPGQCPLDRRVRPWLRNTTAVAVARAGRVAASALYWSRPEGGRLKGIQVKAPFFALLVLLAGCVEKAIEIRPTNNAAIQVETLFTKDGCTVYRFNDDGRRYFVRCESGQTRTEWSTTYPCGKSVCTARHEIPGA